MEDTSGRRVTRELEGAGHSTFCGSAPLTWLLTSYNGSTYEISLDKPQSSLVHFSVV